jgi:transcriptional regulator with XRE-family HTH domain
MDDLPTFDGRQLTAARALAEMTVADLAEKANVTPRTVHRIEIGGTVIVAAVREAGVELLSEDSTHGSGVRWARSRSVRPKLPQE